MVTLIILCLTGPLEHCPVTSVPVECKIVCENYCGEYQPRLGWISWIQPGCEDNDLDQDGDVDLKDIALWMVT